MMKRAKCLVCAWAVLLSSALVAAPIGCNSQYSDLGTIDMAASKAAAAKSGNDKTTAKHTGRAGQGSGRPK